MIKLIASDIDGTLLPEGTDRINPEIFEVIRKLKEKDVLFAAASGRHYSSMVKLFREVEKDIIFISGNGSYVCCRGYTMLEDVIDWNIIKSLVEEIRQIPKARFILDTKESLYTESQDPEFWELVEVGYQSKLTYQENVLEEEKKVVKISLYLKENIQELAEKMTPGWKDRLSCVVAGNIWLDFMNKTVNKGNAIRSIQEILHISPDETMAFGDNHNDLEMLKSATESYAMGNAAEAVKQVANHIADTNVNDGVLKVMKTLLKAEAE